MKKYNKDNIIKNKLRMQEEFLTRLINADDDFDDTFDDNNDDDTNDDEDNTDDDDAADDDGDAPIEEDE